MDQFCTAANEFYNIYKHFYTQSLLYLLAYLCLYIDFIAVHELPEDDQDRSEHI